MRRAVLTLSIVLSLHADNAWAQRFADIVRDLNVMQNRMVAGDSVARDQAAKQFDAVERAIGAADPAIWTDESNVRAAIVYLLCGGASGKLRAFLDAKNVDGSLSPLLAASVQYADGDPAAAKALSGFDARQYPPLLGGHLALVQGGALMGSDKPRAIELFDLARLLMPGSLVEEAALRREMSILDPSRDGEKLGLLAVRYATKYRASPFARHFWEMLPAMALSTPASASQGARFGLIFDKAPPNERIDFYLALSRRALLAGNLVEAGATVDKAASVGSDAMARKRVGAYRIALATLRDEQSASALRALDVAGLPRADIDLIELVTSVETKLSAVAPTDARQSAAIAPEEERYEVETAVRRALSDSDELLKRAERQ